MIKDLIIFLLTFDGMLYVLFVPTLALAFIAGLISLIRGLSRWT